MPRIKHALYTYGQDIRFTDAESESYLVSGWSGPEDTLRWSEGKESHIRIPVKNISGRMRIRMTVNPMIYGNLTKQRVKCIVNNTYIRDLVIDKSGDYSIVLENITISNNLLDLVMRYADAASPAQLGLNDDKRILGVAFSKMRFDLPPLYTYGQDIRFTDAESESYLVSGWSGPEGAFRWSDGKESHIKIPVKNVTGRMRITMTVNPLIYGNLTKQRVKCIVNNIYIRDLVIDKPGDYSIGLDNITIRNNLLDVVMRYADAVSPSSIGFSNDQRLLAVQFSRMKIEIQ
jgi:hypothetical protein